MILSKFHSITGLPTSHPLASYAFQKPRLPNTIPTNGNDVHPTDEMFVYNPDSRAWRRRRTPSPCPPPPGFGYTSCVRENTLYVFDGDTLHECNLNCHEWRSVTLKEEDSVAPPQSRNSLLLSRGGLLYLFGGYGEHPHLEEVFLVALSSDLVLADIATFILPCFFS